jgi:hypothetical protein
MHQRAAVLPSKCACFRSCREKGRRATGFGEGERQERRETVVRRGTWAANLGRRAGMAPIAGLCRGQGKGSTVRLRRPNTACTVRQGKGKGKERQRRTRFARAPRVSQPAEPARAGSNHAGSVPARRRSGRRKMPNPAGLGVGHWRCLSAPHVASPERSRSGPTVPAHPAPRTGFGYGVPDVPTHGPGDVRRWGWHRVLRAHVSAVY